MADRFAELRQQISAADAARAYGIFIGRNGMACCPFHSDRTPSCSFKNGFFHCFGCATKISAQTASFIVGKTTC